MIEQCVEIVNEFGVYTEKKKFPTHQHSPYYFEYKENPYYCKEMWNNVLWTTMHGSHSLVLTFFLIYFASDFTRLLFSPLFPLFFDLQHLSSIINNIKSFNKNLNLSICFFFLLDADTINAIVALFLKFILPMVLRVLLDYICFHKCMETSTTAITFDRIYLYISFIHSTLFFVGTCIVFVWCDGNGGGEKRETTNLIYQSV